MHGGFGIEVVDRDVFFCVGDYAAGGEGGGRGDVGA